MVVSRGWDGWERVWGGVRVDTPVLNYLKAVVLPRPSGCTRISTHCLFALITQHIIKDGLIFLGHPGYWYTNPKWRPLLVTAPACRCPLAMFLTPYAVVVVPSVCPIEVLYIIYPRNCRLDLNTLPTKNR